jgi:hexulose-6-phosphate isomerase
MSAPLIGVMQGRLVPPEEGRFQSFPAARWRDEFPLAGRAGLACIEWIYEEPNEDRNPLRTDDGLAEMQRLSATSGVGVWSICADYYMTRRLIAPDGQPVAEAVAHLRWLISRARAMKISYIVLPFVDSSALRSPAEKAALVPLLRKLIPDAAAAGAELHLETDFLPQELAHALAEIDHPLVRANYDIGNSASLGFDCRQELSLLAPWLGSVHVKDRVLGGGTVPLGTGAADLAAAFRGIREAGFDRWLIMQVARCEPGHELAWCRTNRRRIESEIMALEVH